MTVSNKKLSSRCLSKAALSGWWEGKNLKVVHMLLRKIGEYIPQGLRLTFSPRQQLCVPLGINEMLCAANNDKDVIIPTKLIN